MRNSSIMLFYELTLIDNISRFKSNDIVQCTGIAKL